MKHRTAKLSCLSHLIDVKNVIPRQLTLAHGAHHDVAERRKVLLADGHVGVGRLDVHVDLEDLRDRLLHLHEPLLADVVHGVLLALDDVAGAVSTVEVVLALLLSIVAGALKLRRPRESFLVRGTVGATVHMTEACVAQAAVLRELFFTCETRNL